jgi:polyketide synthase 12/epothilone polyketide synthase D
MSCRLPGGVSDPEAFWRLLDEGRDAITEVPRARWDIDALYDPDPDAPGKMTTRCGGFLSDIEHFDPAFFGISPREAASMDPQQRLLLEASWEAIERAGQTPERLMGSDTGVFVGFMYQEYGTLAGGLEALDGYISTGNAASVASGRISYVLGLKGPSMTVDTACSSSLVAVHLACQSLRQGECSMALAGGVALMLTPATFVEFSRLRGLASDGRCKSFSASADGVGWGEGCSMLVLKRLGDAQRDGDPILALIRGSAVNQDGRSNGLTAPNGPSQEEVIRRALAQAGVLPAEVEYVECHGTGTSLGDPIEVQALGAALAEGRAPDRPVVIGSVKSNIGHTQAAAGAAGVMKVVLALEHGQIPKSLHFDAPSPHIPWSELPVKVAAEPMEWQRNGAPRRAGVSSFGVSGTNAHVVLEEAPAAGPRRGAPERAAELFVLSAKNAAALDAQASRLRDHLEAHPELGLGDVAFSLATTRSAMEHRLAVAATSREQLQATLQAAAQGQTPPGAVRGAVASSRGKLAFLFTGQGAQTLGMGRGLYEAWPAFREAFDRCVALFDRELERPLREVMWAEPGSAEAALLDQTAYTQPALFALEYALFALWRAWGITPDMVAGHSIGELVAACVAGVFSLEDAVRLVAARGRLMQALPAGGAMVSIAAAEAEVAAAVAPHAASVSIAAINGPEQVVIAGAEQAVQAIAQAFAARGVRTKALSVSHAFHSPLMAPMLEAFGHVAESVTYQRPSLALVSNVSGKPSTEEVSTPGYWVRHVREAVRFSDGVKALHEAGAGTFIEVGPKPTLLGLVPACLPDAAPALLASLRAGRDEATSVLEALGGFWTLGGAVDWSRLFPAGGRRVLLPTYPWQRERYWVEAPADRAADTSHRAHTSGHPLLGKAISVSTQAGLRLWETTLTVKRLPWLDDHRVQGAVVFPGAAYVEMALSSGAEVMGDGPLEITDVVFSEALAFTADATVPVQVVTTEEHRGRLRFQIASRALSFKSAPFRGHALGTVCRAEQAESAARLDLAALRARLGTSVPGAAAYAALAEMGLEYGPAFQGVIELWRGEGEALGRVRLPEAAGPAAAYRLHPALLDACFQVMGGALAGRGEATPWVPVEVGSMRLFQRPSGELWCHARRVSRGPESRDRRSADFWVADATGAVVAEVSGLVVQRLASGEIRREEDDWFLELAWEPAAVPAPTITAGRWLLLGGGEIGAALHAALEAAGHAAVHAPENDTSAAGVRALLAKAFGGQAPTAVVHLGSLDVGSALDADTLEATLVRGCDSVLALVQALAGTDFRDAPRLWLITRGAQAAGGGDVSATQAPLLGLGRVITSEHPELRCARVDLDPARPGGEVGALLAELLGGDAEEEVALRGGERLVARLVRRLPEPERREKSEPAGDRPFRLEMDEPGALDRLVLRATERRPPGPGEVEIAVEAAGLSFLDVMQALGEMPSDPPGAANAPLVLGGECAGRIVALGEGVQGLTVGQPVIALVGGAFASHVTTSATLVLPRPLGLSAAEASSLPIAALTAWYALDRVARLQRGERVLIHAATGGVGLAAVQWAQHVGAEIYATASTPEKPLFTDTGAS